MKQKRKLYFIRKQSVYNLFRKLAFAVAVCVTSGWQTYKIEAASCFQNPTEKAKTLSPCTENHPDKPHPKIQTGSPIKNTKNGKESENKRILSRSQKGSSHS